MFLGRPHLCSTSQSVQSRSFWSLTSGKLSFMRWIRRKQLLAFEPIQKVIGWPFRFLQVSQTYADFFVHPGRLHRRALCPSASWRTGKCSRKEFLWCPGFQPVQEQLENVRRKKEAIIELRSLETHSEMWWLLIVRTLSSEGRTFTKLHRDVALIQGFLLIHTHVVEPAKTVFRIFLTHGH